MPYRRTYRRRRLTRRPRRMMRRRPTRSLALKRRSNVHHFKRTFTGSAIQSATTTTFGAYTFQFTSLPNNTEFSALFDQYRINKIVIKFVPNHNSSEFGATKAIPQFHTCLDWNDSTAPTSLNEMYEYQSWKMTKASSTHTRVFVPSSILTSVDNTSVVASNPKWKQWINTAETDVIHYGLKYGLGATNAIGDITFTPYITYYYSCKSVK